MKKKKYKNKCPEGIEINEKKGKNGFHTDKNVHTCLEKVGMEKVSGKHYYIFVGACRTLKFWGEKKHLENLRNEQR